jgi:enediyne biosynthesis thioesterase
VTDGARPPYFEYRHVVGFEETNLVGNVYFTSHLRWQGRCREMFLNDHAPDVVAALRSDLALVTVRCSCEYLGELTALDMVAVRMRLAVVAQNRVAMRFEYVLVREGRADALVARGEQEIACMKRDGHGLVACALPASLARALARYQS